MKIALLSDLHANRRALQACLAHAHEQGATHHAFLGDLVGYGAEPAEVLDLVMDWAVRGAWVVRGNHDDAALAPTLDSGRADDTGAPWTAARLTSTQRHFLQGLPFIAQHDFILFVHASAHEPQRWEYIQSPLAAGASLDAASAMGATHVFGGHVHEQRLFFQGASQRLMAFEPTAGVAIPLPRHRHWLATIGSVGQPRDGRTEAMYAMFDTEALQLTFLRVPYDHEAAARAIRQAGLPEFYAWRLTQGR